jgi:Zn-dependent protease
MKAAIEVVLAILFVALMFDGCILVHEFGHALMARCIGGKNVVQEIWAGSLEMYRWKIVKIGIFPTWGGVRFAEGHFSPNGLRWVALAGPLASLALALCFYGFSNLPFLDGGWKSSMQIMGLFNVYMAGVNLLPIPPLDGWKIAETYLPHFGIQISQNSREAIYRGGLAVVLVISVMTVLIVGPFRA